MLGAIATTCVKPLRGLHGTASPYDVYVTTPAFGHPLGATPPFPKEQLRCNACVTTPAFGHPF